jgi:uncharacterized protein involved in response to NO
MIDPRTVVPPPEPPETIRGSRLLSSVPHRFFFLVGVTQMVLISLWWAWTLAARAWPWLPAPGAAMADTTLHAVLMICGFAPFFMFGFLFTAGPRWLGVEPPPASARFPAGALAAIAALLLVPLQVVAPVARSGAIRAAAGAYAIGWLWLLFVFFRLIRASEAPDKVHATLVLIAQLVGASAIAAFALVGTAAHGWVRGAGFWAFLLPVFVVVCHRMIPFFTASVVPFVTAFRPWWLLAALVGAPVAHGVIGALGFDDWTWPLDLPFAALMLWLTVRWGLVQSLRNRLLAMLHLGFVWYGIGFLLAGAHSLAILAGGAGVPHAALHALAIGFAASLLMAMVTRVTWGHSGRTLAADTLTWRLFQVLQASALVRVAAEVLPGPGLVVAGALWLAAFVPWCLKYAPVYWRPRSDGRPG